MKNWGHSSRKDEKFCGGKLLTTTEAKNTTELRMWSIMKQ
jgi:hypothetical protein